MENSDPNSLPLGGNGVELAHRKKRTSCTGLPPAPDGTGTCLLSRLEGVQVPPAARNHVPITVACGAGRLWPATKHRGRVWEPSEGSHHSRITSVVGDISGSYPGERGSIPR